MSYIGTLNGKSYVKYKTGKCIKYNVISYYLSQTFCWNLKSINWSPGLFTSMVTYYRNEETIVCIRSTFHLNLCSVLVDYSDPIKASLSEYTRLSECSEMESHSLFHIAIFYFLIRDLRMSKYNLSNLMIGCFPMLNYIWGTRNK